MLLLKTKAEVYGSPHFSFHANRAGGVPLRGNAEVLLGPTLISNDEDLNHEFTESTRMIPIIEFTIEATSYS
jgi:hypothetical protein